MKSSLPSQDAPSAAARSRVTELLFDVFACALYSRRLEPRARFVDGCVGGEPQALIWFDGRRTDAERAALVNGTLAHHADFDDGNSRAGLHGGVTVIPAAVAAAELVGASGLELIDAIAFGYAAGVAYGRPLLAELVDRRVHPPSRVGCLGAAAAASRLLRLDPLRTEGAIALAGTLMPLGPFESFTQGAGVKDLYGGYPASIGIRAALFADAGILGPTPWLRPEPVDLDEVSNVYVKPWPSCRATHAALTALEQLLPLRGPIERIEVETYPFAAELSHDSPRGGRTSIPATFESVLETPVAERVRVHSVEELGPSGARVTIRYADRSTARATVEAPRSEDDPRAKLRAHGGDRAASIEAGIDGLAEAPGLTGLLDALTGDHPGE